MNLLENLGAEAGAERHRIILATVIAGVANTFILASVNSMVAAPDTVDARAFYTYAVLVVMYAANARYANHRTTELVEAVVHRIKVRIGDKLAHTELDALERVNAAEICDRITDNASLVSYRAGMIATMVQSAAIMVFAAFYIAWLAPAAFTLVALCCTAGALKFLDIRRRVIVLLMESLQERVTFLERLTDMLAGFKEAQFGRRRRTEIREHITEASDVMRVTSTKINNLFSDGVLVGDAVRFLVLAAVVYTLPRVLARDAPALMSIVSAILFLWRPFIGFIMGWMPYVRSDLALKEMVALEAKLEAAMRQGAPAQHAKDPWDGQIGAIAFRDIEYAYPQSDGRESFCIGPLTFEIKAGEVLFIVGGNGSGKSTLLKVLTGLYPPTSGSLFADGIVISRENVVPYRNMISAIFTDFHLFAKLYGLAEVDEEAVHRLITRMRLDGQTSFVNRAFTKLTLSTGQKKRLAMIVALLEARPICVFDEWAADQDPEFRRYFYEELLPALRREGKMVIVVSHDDRYFHCADRVLTMRDGTICTIEEPTSMAVSA